MTNFVLVHGGMIGSNCWKTVREILENQQHQVLTPTLTGLGERKHLINPDIDLETHIQDVLNAVFYEELDDIVLVGHSYGGMVITGVADRIPNKIVKLVYVAAVLPNNGESAFDALGPEISSFLNKSAQQGNGWELPVGSPGLYGIQNPETATWFQQMSSPQPIKTFQQKIQFKNSTFQDHKKIYINCSQDPALKRFVSRAKDRDMSYFEINSGHFPMLTSPATLAELFLTF